MRFPAGFTDINTEWGVLNQFMEHKNQSRIFSVTEGLFTDERQRLLTSMQQATTRFGIVSLEGIRQYYGEDIPGELLAARLTDLDAGITELVRLAVKRQSYEIGQQLVALSREDNPEVNILKETLIFEPIVAKEDSSLALGANSFLSDIAAKNNGTYEQRDTGLGFLNAFVGHEYKKGKLFILMGDSGSGKTTLVLNSMVRMADPSQRTTKALSPRKPIPSLFFSLEMEKDELTARWIADQEQIEYGTLVKGIMNEKMQKRVENATINLQKLPMYILDNSRMTLTNILYEIRRHVQDYGVQVVFIDYLQIINYHKEGDYVDLGVISGVLKDIAKQLGITVFVIAQKNRGGEGMHALRGSSIPVNDADVIMELVVTEEGTQIKKQKDMMLAFWKNRLGATGTWPILFRGNYQRFEGDQQDMEE